MRRLIFLSSIVAVLAVAAISAVVVFRASQSVPSFYSAALAVEPQDQREACDAFVAEATALAGDLSEPGHWESLFTAEQVNAWLALELSTNYPELLPAELSDPRISLSAGEATIGCRYHAGDIQTVLSLAFDAYLQEPNVVAVRIRRARAGALPVPLGQVLDSISHAARELNLRLEWRKAQGDPVALITVPQPHDSSGAPFSLDLLEVRDGELFVAGTVGSKSYDASPIVPEPLRVPTAKLPKSDDQPRVGAAEKETRQN